MDGTMALEKPIWVLGTMSGTSMDGVDGAMVLTDGAEVQEFGATGFRPYLAAERRAIAAAQGAWPGGAGVAEAARVVEQAHAELAARFGGIELIGFHGQTLAHEPGRDGRPGRTHQAGDGARLAALTGHPVAWDFRSADMAAGGQGAPLAPFFHHALARRLSLGRVAVLNIGGVANVTFVNPAHPLPEQPGALLAFDTGPGNALVDDLVRARTGLACDYGGALAAAGRVEEGVIARFLADPWFAAKPPKSLDRHHFHWLLDAVAELSDIDAAATLAEACVAGIRRAFQAPPFPVGRVLVAGGGRRNAHLMARLKAVLPVPVEDADQAGIDADMLEAQAFAYLAARVKAGLPLSAPTTTGVPRPVTGGRIALPGGVGG